MRFVYRPSYGRSLKRLDPKTKSEVTETVCQIIDFYSKGIGTPGLGIKNLRGSYWEGRAGLKMRVLFKFTHDFLEFVLAGNHDDIKRFLSRL